MQIEKDYPPLALLLYLQSAPPDVIFSAFRQDCASRGVEWYSPESQNVVLEYCLRHPVSKKYPPRYSTLRSFLKQYITSLEDPSVTTIPPIDGEQDPIHMELMEAYISLNVMNSDINDNWCYKTFFNPFIERHRTTRRSELKYLNIEGTAIPGKQEEEEETLHNGEKSREERHRERRQEKKEILSMFCPVRVSCSQLSNVGLSLWPAAFVAITLLAQEFMGASRILARYLFPNRQHWGGVEEANEPPLPVQQRMNILELGSGVGLTPILLHRIPAYRRYVNTFVVSDYQASIIENMNYNLQENHVTQVHDYVAALKGLEGEKEMPFHLTTTLDWTEHDTVRDFVAECPPKLILAADCIYDVDIIPDLVATIKTCMTEPYHISSISRSNRFSQRASVNDDPMQRVCVVVQTHRQNSTMKVFFDSVKEFANVRSYVLLRRPIGELRRRLSKTRNGKDRGVIPLGEWATSLEDGPSMFVDDERIVCALYPDEVLSDGSMRGFKVMKSREGGGNNGSSSLTTTTTRADGRDAPLPNPPAHSPGSGSGDYESSINSGSFRRSVFSAGTSTQGGTGHYSMGTLQAVDIDQLLKDDMIGPFYTSMAGLVGVHILRCKGADPDELTDEVIAQQALRKPPRPPTSRRGSGSHRSGSWEAGTGEFSSGNSPNHRRNSLSTSPAEPVFPLTSVEVGQGPPSISSTNTNNNNSSSTNSKIDKRGSLPRISAGSSSHGHGSSKKENSNSSSLLHRYGSKNAKH